ncbi:MAG: Type 1 glutamine amidotransferase-like domain-containing protein [Candidatus Staskawiczbacteria bacterium]|nr:Type 1 glutamine amidotransferase-like domain-containing protein [Candidatus Staskawiczbacteria bacterium]
MNAGHTYVLDVASAVMTVRLAVVAIKERFMNNALSSSSVIIYLQMAGIVIFLLILSYIAKRIEKTKKENQIKTLLLTSSGMPSIKNDLKKLLQKPLYDVTVGFITTAAKPQENIDYVQRDWDIMKEELRFEVEEIDIEGKTEDQVLKLLEFKDIIFVEGGNTFYLLKAMRACNFERVIKKLLKQGKVYIGVSAGSMVGGKTIITSVWRGEAMGINRNEVGLKNFKGLNLVPFDIFVHYGPEYEAIIKQKMPNSRKRAKNLKIITDEQAILVQGKEIDLIGEGEAVVI